MQGQLSKMTCQPGEQVEYRLNLGGSEQEMNTLIGRRIRISYLSAIICQHCGRKTNKSFAQGHCYPCFQTLASCDLCIMSPDRCHLHLGPCRDESFAERFCLQPHRVYLANSTGLKVGITRAENLPSRWLDQGATQGLVIMTTATRRQSGLVEAVLKAHVSDRTQWQRMLKSAGDVIDLEAERDRLMDLAQAEIAALQAEFGTEQIAPAVGAEPMAFTYPVAQYPEKVKSHNLEKLPVLEGELQGIKGQYLILDHTVINLRKYTGYEVALQIID